MPYISSDKYGKHWQLPLFAEAQSTQIVALLEVIRQGKGAVRLTAWCP